MRIKSAILKSIYCCTFILATLVAVTGCVTSPLDTQSLSADGQAQYYINKARQSSGQQRVDWLLLASEALLSQQRTDKALSALNSVNPKDLTDTTRQLYHMLMAQALTSAQRTAKAADQYTKITQPDLLKKHQQISYYRDYAELLNSLSRHYESAIKRIALSELLTDQLEIEENRELLWLSLIQVENLKIYSNSLNSYLVTGWLELADLAKRYANQPETLLSSLEQWRRMFSEHPASKQMPIDMARAEAARSYRPDNIAVLLPESGRLASSAKQIKDGLLSAIYELPVNQRPEILFFDSSKTDNIQSLYQQAMDQGASFVIGPLRRESVEMLASQEHFPVPVLTINRLSDEVLVPQNFYQFGLPVEDEARQIAIKAWEDGHGRAIVLVPRGVLGERTTNAFTEQFERLGGEVQEVVSYDSGRDYSRAVQQLLGVDKSTERHTRLQQLLGVNLEHEARRRQDADFLFFKATAQQARRIKPFIDFYYAHDLPLYSTSSIYSGKVDRPLDRDLDNVIFCDIPWLISDEQEISRQKQHVSAFLPDSTDNRSARLFALGYDLFSLIPELNRLRNFPQYRMKGLSGTLSVDNLGHVQRTLSWARFINGKATEITEK